MNTTYSSHSDSKFSLKEQLRLFAFDDISEISPEVLIRAQNEMSMRERIVALLEGELNFHGENSGYASHDLHAFAAKFPPQLPRAFIRGLTSPGEVVLDPMMGSGTTVVEALLEKRIGVGLDIDPLAMHLCNVKITSVNVTSIREAGIKVLSRANKFLSNGSDIENYLNEQFDETSKNFINYWFTPVTQKELVALLFAIREVDEPLTRRFLELTFSSIIVTKSGGVSRARDLAHTRPHLDKTKVPKNALESFSQKLRKNIASIAELPIERMNAFVINGDTRQMPISSQTVDLIITSPPYANAIDYMRAHKFSLVWFNKPIKELSELRARYIGSERITEQYESLPEMVETIIGQLSVLDKSKASILRKYFSEMRLSLAEMFRVLRNNSAAIVVVGTSTMRGLDVQTHSCLADIASGLGFDVVGVVKRVLDRNKRMMPARFGKKTDSMIEQRMHDEYVIGLLKP